MSTTHDHLPGFWLCLSAALAVCALAACTQPADDRPDDTVCTAEAVLATNPATGLCEWVSTCEHGDWDVCANGFGCEELPTEACGLDARCQLETRSTCNECLPAYDGDPSCGCFQESSCTTRPVDSACATLSEASCMATPGCQPLYGWSDAHGGERPADPAPCLGDCGAPPPAMPIWGFLGCQQLAPSGCADLDEVACLAAPGCTPLYLATPCFCQDPNLGCECPSMFAGCENSKPSGCAEIADPLACGSTPGCQWSDLGGLAPCVCDNGDCACEPPMGGSCVEVPLPRDCAAISDEGTCWSNPACEWQGAQDWCECDATGQCWCEAQPGICAPRTAPSCWELYDEGACWSFPGCEWITEGGGDCFCDPAYPGCDCKVMPGYCQPAQTQSCWDLYDPYSCTSAAGCEWIDVGGTDCYCDPAFPGCDCMVMSGYCQPVQQTTCWDLFDAYTCAANPECQWSGSSDPYPCNCLPDDPSCGCGVPAPPYGFCEPRPQTSCYDFGDEWSCGATPGCQWTTVSGEMPCVCDAAGNCNCGPDACWGAWVDQAGNCRAPNDGSLPQECCYGTGVVGYCEPATQPPACEGYWDQPSCEASQCLWIWETCACLPDDPNCACKPGGFCVSG